MDIIKVVDVGNLSNNIIVYIPAIDNAPTQQ